MDFTLSNVVEIPEFTSRGNFHFEFFPEMKFKPIWLLSVRDECRAQVNGFAGAIYKKFGTKSDAQNFATSELGYAGSKSIETGLKVSENGVIAKQEGVDIEKSSADIDGDNSGNFVPFASNSRIYLLWIHFAFRF